MGFLPEDKKVRCGYGPILSTGWVWKLLNKLKLTRYKEDPFISVCEFDDRLTDQSLPASNILTNEEELERVDAAFDEVNKDVKHPRVAAFYKGVLHAVRKYFDK